MNRFGLPDMDPAFRSRWILAQPVQTRWELSRHFALRHRVFVAEQGIFSDDDRDAYDARAVPIVALATSAGVPTDVIGTVRIYEAEDCTWYGGRLAVVPEYRRCREVGSALTRAAVGGARGWGARRFLATVQQENETFFARHHFRTLSRLTLHGRPHCLMEADMSAFVVPSWCARFGAGGGGKWMAEPAA